MYLSADYVSKHSTIGRYDLTSPGTAFGNDAVLRASDGGVWILPYMYWTRTPANEESYTVDFYYCISNMGRSDLQSQRSQNSGIVIGFSI